MFETCIVLRHVVLISCQCQFWNDKDTISHVMEIDIPFEMQCDDASNIYAFCFTFRCALYKYIFEQCIM